MSPRLIFLKYLLLVDRDLWSTFHALYVTMIFITYSYDILLVDHNLWSTLHAIIVSLIIFFKVHLSTPMYFTGRLYFVVYPPHVYTN